ncbi:unnamed protein product [Miscanthus lutarioriparius]|uniref:Uncharacterized protein n=1 Tax=Miscanthus lutarioriparius TaxID=422564 RepID=A0A811MY92_9POAL|nr:unnamed protein product [Miscanthus lutarioriparius]
MAMDAQDEERPLIHHLSPQDETSEFTSDGTVDISNLPARKQRTGNWTACFFILGAEFTECVAFFAISKNLVTYLTGVLHESNVNAATTVSTWIGTAFFKPLIGAFLADTLWGRYWTIVIFISVYVIKDSVLLPLPVPGDDDPDWFSSSSTADGLVLQPRHSPPHRVPGPLYLVALGNGGIKPCVSALGADQFDAADPVERVTKGSFFSWNYHLVLPEDSSALHQVPSPTEGNHCKIQHTSQFRFLDKAAIVAPSSSDGEKGPISPWRLCTVSQVEELKTVLRMFPVWVSMVLFFAVTAQMSSTFIEQGETMDSHVRPFNLPPGSLAIFDIISVMFCIPIYDRVLVPLARRATGKARGLSQLQRLGVGLALSVAGMVYAALVEARRLSLAHAAPDRQPSMSIMWQAPAFAVLGAGEVFKAIGTLEFFYDQSPDGMKSLGTALAHLATAAGNYFNSAVLAAVATVTTRNGKPGWIPDDLNKGHLDYFFWLMAVLGVVNLLYFLHCSIRYRGNGSSSTYS